MSKTAYQRAQEAYRDILSDRPVRFQLPLNSLFHEIGGDFERLSAMGIDTDEFEYMRRLGYAKETLGMTGESMHRIYRQVIYSRCKQVLTGPGANQLPETIRVRIEERKKDLESRFHDLEEQLPPMSKWPDQTP